MIIYCAGPIKGDTKYQKYYKEIIDYLISIGHTALSELNDDFKTSVPLTAKQIFKRDIKWIESSQLLIAEVSGHSLGVGFEVSYAIYKKEIPVLALINEKALNESAMIVGCDSKKITVKNYSDSDDLKKIITDFVKKNG